MASVNDQAAVLDRVTKRFRTTTALDSVSLSIERGAVTALLGPNGAGKTTAISLWLGLSRPDAGSLSVLGGVPQSLAVRRRVGVMMQSAALPDTLRVRELLRLTSSYYARPLPLAVLAELTGVGTLLHRPYGKLSGGQQRRVQFALAVCGRPQLLFLDEPTTGLDVEARQGLWQVVRELVRAGCTVLLTTHYLEEADALADRVAVLMHGRVVSEGTVEEIRSRCLQRRIRCISVLPAEEVARWPGVHAASRREAWLTVEASVAEPVVQRLLAADPQLQQLEVSAAGLGDALAHITREAA